MTLKKGGINQIDANIKELINRFNEIKKLGYVKSISKYSNGVGDTFEHLLGKTRDNLPLPDFKGIEIKTKLQASDQPINLFSLSPKRDDGIFFGEYLLNNYGSINKHDNNLKVFTTNLFHNKSTPINDSYNFKLVITKTKLKIIIKERYKYIDYDTSWDLTELCNRLLSKMNYLAFVKADHKYINKEKHYHYTKINILKLKKFKTFLNLIKQGKIFVHFNITERYRSDGSIQIHNHGVSFRTYQRYIPLLYQEIIND